MGPLLKFLLIAFAVYFIVRFLFRLILPFAMRKAAERIMKKAQQSQYTTGGNPFEYREYRQNPQEEGKVRIEVNPTKETKSKSGTSTAGEFVDFEEIK
ncbi:DUF4834 family protein [Sphingobacterium sp. SYP-B4668]|uniref:DUF4834 family protein n=1 Tax=Sphingobacterium sp. SYP-B4668 TaxID=2996035 RepID=UPI0022DD0B2C|nr:DUF4834 family protein [Sphingobacterium sp. SYP-B4668]